MTRVDVVRSTYNRHFDDLEKMRSQFKALKEALALIQGGEDQPTLEVHIAALEAEMDSYAKELHDGGIVIMKRVA